MTSKRGTQLLSVNELGTRLATDEKYREKKAQWLAYHYVAQGVGWLDKNIERLRGCCEKLPPEQRQMVEDWLIAARQQAINTTRPG